MENNFNGHPIIISPYNFQKHLDDVLISSPVYNLVHHLYCCKDAKENKTTMKTHWIPGVNNLGKFDKLIECPLLENTGRE
jgi:hypothetical protein